MGTVVHTYSPALGRLIKENPKFKVSLIYNKKTYLKSKHTHNSSNNYLSGKCTWHGRLKETGRHNNHLPVSPTICKDGDEMLRSWTPKELRCPG